LSAAQVYQVFNTSLTVNWASLGANGSEGYELDASTANNFTGTLFSSTTADVNQSTLTVIGLAPFTTYYLRVSGINWENAVNYVFIGSTQTSAGGAPGNPTISSVFISTIAVNWTTVPNTTGYEVD